MISGFFVWVGCDLESQENPSDRGMVGSLVRRVRPDKDIRYDILGKNKNQERSSSYLRLLFEVELERMNQDSE
jgi:hypothetical protein